MPKQPAASTASSAPTQINDFDALGQAELIAKGKCSPAEALESAIARIEELNGELNAVIHFTYDKARAQAEALDKVGDKNKPIFGGVPMLYKDLMCTSAGDPHHCGANALKSRGATSKVDSYMHLSFMKAGFLPCGRTNVPEMGLSPTTEPLAYGATKNPWDKTRSPGGSSGGSGAAVASRMVPVAHANDAGGSIRIPASACGLVGLKPTRGRISSGPETWDTGFFSNQGVLTRSVRDTAAVLDILSGMYAGDPYTAPLPRQPYINERKSSPKGLRAGFMTKVVGGQEELHPECKIAVEKACKLVEDLGCVVEPEFPSRLNDFIPKESGVAMNVNLAKRVDFWGKHFGAEIPLSEFEPPTAMMIERGRGFSAVEFLEANEVLHKFSGDVRSWWDDGFDILITPTLPMPPLKLGELASQGDPMEIFPKMGKVVRYVSPFNITGQPAISLPLHQTEEGLPIGVQFIAPYGHEDLLLNLAFSLEPSFATAG